ncbi:MAG TPA: AmmeMemoRadiSam system protein B, partial [Geobacteraceae bacterium]
TLCPVSPKLQRVVGIIAPHAGYIYSGAVAGAVYGSIEVPATVIVLGPNHHGVGARAALYPEGSWLTPLGEVPIADRLAELVAKHAPFVEIDSTAHHYEHSLEVQVPFLQYRRPDVTIVPLCLGFGDPGSCRELGEALARAITEFGDQVLIVASSDMSHYEPDVIARQKDRLAIEELLALNPAELLKVCRDQRITMCGVVPAAVMLTAATTLGASTAELIRYATSGEVSGDLERVVGYAALTVF